MLIAIKDKYKNVLIELETDETNEMESIWVKVGTKTKYKIGVVYLPQGEKLKSKEIK